MSSSFRPIVAQVIQLGAATYKCLISFHGKYHVGGGLHYWSGVDAASTYLTRGA
jgi:hypothetical protein